MENSADNPVQYHSIQNLISELKSKNVSFNIMTQNEFKMYLKNENYVNVIDTAKKYIYHIEENNNRTYPKTDIQVWVDLYECDLKLREEITRNILTFERNFKSQLSYFISLILSNNTFDWSEEFYNLIITFIDSNLDYKYKEYGYNKDEYWKNILKLSFGSLIKLYTTSMNFYYKDKSRRNRIHSSLDQCMISMSIYNTGDKFNYNKTTDLLHDYRILRNTVIHHTPLTIYLLKENPANIEESTDYFSTMRKRKFDAVKNFLHDDSLCTIMDSMFNTIKKRDQI